MSSVPRLGRVGREDLAALTQEAAEAGQSGGLLVADRRVLDGDESRLLRDSVLFGSGFRSAVTMR